MVQHVMNAPPATVLPTESIEDAAQYMADAGVGALPVVNGDAVIGIVTDRDLVVRAMARRLPSHTPVETIMSRTPATVEADTAVAVAVVKMRAAEVRHLPVVAEGRLIGMISFDDLFWRLTQELADLAAVVDAARKIPGTFHGTRKAPLLDG
ncbi:CBS domain-containing protein [Streptomyces sp. NPDC058964]|uniref:CBS domain-containing protein n=1 Tax=Streptomyces sp. NPDC058964 TaxID=3346681 RepID=UPI003695C59E